MITLCPSSVQVRSGFASFRRRIGNRVTWWVQRTVAGVLVLLVSACASVSQMSTGDQVVGGRLAVTLPGAWNQLNLPGSAELVWTQEGVTIDKLQFWVALKEGQELAKAAATQRPLQFKVGMQPHELGELLMGFYSRDGSTVQLDRIEPTEFAGSSGVKVRFTVVRKSDDVRLSGVAYASVRSGELTAMSFVAPRLVFFPRQEAAIEQIARSARLRV